MFLGRLTSPITHGRIETSIDMNAGHRYGPTIDDSGACLSARLIDVVR